MCIVRVNSHQPSLVTSGLCLLAHFSSVTVAYRGSWTSTIRLVCPELSDDKQKKTQKESERERNSAEERGKERDSFAGFPSKALPHCSRFLAHFASPNNTYPAMTQGRRPERAL